MAITKHKCLRTEVICYLPICLYITYYGIIFLSCLPSNSNFFWVNLFLIYENSISKFMYLIHCLLLINKLTSLKWIGNVNCLDTLLRLTCYRIFICTHFMMFTLIMWLAVVDEPSQVLVNLTTNTAMHFVSSMIWHMVTWCRMCLFRKKCFTVWPIV